MATTSAAAQHKRVIDFPQGFYWGASTSAHQVEGDNRHSDWWAWEQAGRVIEKSGKACDHYNRFAADFDLARSLGHNAHRFSIEWARIEPEEGVFDEAALAHYAKVIDALLERSMEPFVTLHHFSSPQWLCEKGGWTHPGVVDWFGRYVERVMRVLGDKVKFWMTINEPMVFCHMHYLDGVGPPGIKGVDNALKVTRHIVNAHALAYKVIHERAKGRQGELAVGVPKALVGFKPLRPWYPFDHISSALTDRVFNWAFLDAVTKGEWHVPGLARWRFPEAKDTLDFLGVNYYTRYLIRGSFKGVWPSTYVVSPQAEAVSDMGWEIHPETFTELLGKASRYGKRIYITENGMATLEDENRWRYVARHLEAVHNAMEQGVPIGGYLHWSLLDNFEWACGYSKRFGMVGVDYETQQRTIKPSAEKLAQVCTTNRLETL